MTTQPAAPSMLPCQVCGRGPTAVISVSRNVGMLVRRQFWSYKAPLCRDHGRQLALNWLLATLLMGWWGLISFFVNIGAVVTDLNALRVTLRMPRAGSVIVPPESAMGDPDPGALPRVAPTRLALVAAGIGAILAIGVIGAMFGPKAAIDLAVGDCFDEPTTPGEISEVPHHQCFQAHTAEVFAVVAYSGNQSGTYPTDAEFEASARAQCGPGFDAYTGGGGGAAATVDIGYLMPTATGWTKGDRRMVCYLVAPTGQTFNQSLRAATP